MASRNSYFDPYISGSYSNVGNYSNYQRGWASGLLDLFGGRFGEQSDTFNFLRGSLEDVIYRSGRIGYDFPRNPDELGPIYDVYGNVRGEGMQQGGGQPSREQLFEMRRMAANMRREGRGGEAEAIENEIFKLERQSLYNPDFFKPQFTPRRFYAREQTALRGDASERTADAYQDAMQTFGELQMRLGDFGGGTEAAVRRDMLNAAAADQASAQREVTRFGSQNIRDDMRAFAPLRNQLQLAEADAFAREMQAQNEWNMRLAQMRQQAAMQKRAIAAQGRAASAAARAASAATRQRAFEFAQEMGLKGRQLESQNFFNAITGLGNLGQMQNPLGYGELISGAFNAPLSAYTNIFGNASSAYANMNQRQGNSWLGGLFGALGSVGAALPWAAWSDKRMKTDIKKVATIDGYNIYSFRYKNAPEVHYGMMAQELIGTDAVKQIGNYLVVDYGRV